MKKHNDPERFVAAQKRDYDRALAEIRAGRKRSHWMWYIFPQLKELGYSFNAKFYGINGPDEARAYLAHPVLGPRLIEISEALLELDGSDPEAVMGQVDALKLRSCMTLFACVSGDGSVFRRVIDKYYGGEPDKETLALIGMKY